MSIPEQGVIEPTAHDAFDIAQQVRARTTRYASRCQIDVHRRSRVVVYHSVPTRPTIDGVVARAPFQPIVSTHPENQVGTGCAKERLIVVCTQDIAHVLILLKSVGGTVEWIEAPRAIRLVLGHAAFGSRLVIAFSIKNTISHIFRIWPLKGKLSIGQRWCPRHRLRSCKTPAIPQRKKRSTSAFSDPTGQNQGAGPDEPGQAPHSPLETAGQTKMKSALVSVGCVSIPTNAMVSA